MIGWLCPADENILFDVNSSERWFAANQLWVSIKFFSLSTTNGT